MISASARRLLPPLLTLALSGAPAVAQEVFVDYDTATAYSQIETFQFVATGEDLQRSAPELHRLIVETIRAELVAAKLGEVDQEPDIYVTYHASTRDRFSLGPVQFEYVYSESYSWGSYWETYGTRTARVTTFTEGSLVIDVYTGDGKELIWRGIAIAEITDNRKKTAKKIVRAIERLAKRWEKMHPYGRAIRWSRDTGN